jgi:hypothetical protein
MNHTIDAAIAAHRSWVIGLKSALAGNTTDTFDLSKARDDTDCFLGRWLLTKQASEWLGDGKYNEIVKSHRMFHKLAGSIGDQIKRSNSKENIIQMMHDFDAISMRLIQTLIQAKSKFDHY